MAMAQTAAVKKRVLLIDDEEDFCFFVQKNLERTGAFDVVTTTDPERGILLAREQRPDVILLDIVMPRLLGPRVAEVLSREPGTRRIPLIFITAMVTEKEMGLDPIKEIGGYRFLAKPIRSENLIHAIRLALRQTPEP